MPRLSEKAVGVAVLSILAERPQGEARVEVVKHELPKHIELSEEDRAASPTRSNEEIWEQQVRNLKSHEKATGNIFHDGLVEVVSKGVWRITGAGRAVIKNVA